MKKIGLSLILLTVIFGVSLPALAETVSQKQASKLAEIFFNAANGHVMSKPNLVYNGKRLTTDRLFSPFYVYNHPAGGFVIISAENKAFPILGYSLKENFDPDHIDVPMMELLRSFAKEIELVRYDSDLTDEAVWAWANYNEYVNILLNAAYDATDPVFSSEEIQEMLSNAYGGIDGMMVSDIYTPAQWDDIIGDELVKTHSVVIGVISKGEIHPVVVHGRKGDYYRIAADKPNDWLMMLSATESIGPFQVVLSAFPNNVEDFVAEESVPFELFDEFILQTRGEEVARLDAFEEKLNPTRPIVRNVGGGHYEILIPEEIIAVSTYNLSGGRVNHQTYRNTRTAIVNLEGLPYGFYMVQVHAENGNTYGFKLMR